MTICKYERILILNLVIVLAVLYALNPAKSDDILDQKKELEKIKGEIEESRRNLDSLKNVEGKVLKEISDYEQRASLNKTVLERLNRQLGSLRRSIKATKGQLETSEWHYISSNNRYAKNLRYYYSGMRSTAPQPGGGMSKEKDAFKRLIYLKALAAYDKEELTAASEYLNKTAAEYDELVDKKKSVDNVRVKKRSEYTIIASQKEKKEKDLSKVRRRKESEADRLITLSEAARQMEDIIARLEKARMRRERAGGQIQFDFKTGDFISYKGRLLVPLKGKVTSGFGWKRDRITNLKSFSPGIEITGKKNSAVVAVASGMVVYVGSLRGYGNFVVVEHEDGYYSTYAGLDNLAVVPNQIVGSGDKLSITSTGIVKFELRHGREPLDPVEWIRIDSFE